MFLDLPLLIFFVFIALFTGFVKAGLPVLGGLTSVMTAFIFPPKEAVAITLLYLLAGDIIAVALHWRHAQWQLLKKMLPAIIVGIIFGALTLQQVSNTWLGLLIGSVVIVFVAMEPLREKMTTLATLHEKPVRIVSGTLAGYTTTVASLAGPIMTLYFLLLKIDKHAFVATAALFFLIVNLIKAPIYGALGMFESYYLISYLVTLPVLAFGAFFGNRFLHWIPQKAFNLIIIILTGLGGITLLIKYLLAVI